MKTIRWKAFKNFARWEVLVLNCFNTRTTKNVNENNFVAAIKLSENRSEAQDNSKEITKIKISDNSPLY